METIKWVQRALEKTQSNRVLGYQLGYYSRPL